MGTLEVLRDAAALSFILVVIIDSCCEVSLVRRLSSWRTA